MKSPLQGAAVASGQSSKGRLMRLDQLGLQGPRARPMRLVRFRSGCEVAWGLFADDGETILHVAGGFHAWSPRIAGGEGLHALPLTGRRRLQAEVELLAPVETGATIYDGGAAASVAGATAPGLRMAGAPLGLALVGAPLVGRRNPLKSLFGHALAWRSGDQLAISPVVAVRALPGTPAVEQGLANDLTRLDAAHGLRSGDMVVFTLGSGSAPARAA